LTDLQGVYYPDVRQVAQFERQRPTEASGSAAEVFPVGETGLVEVGSVVETLDYGIVVLIFLQDADTRRGSSEWGSLWKNVQWQSQPPDDYVAQRASVRHDNRQLGRLKAICNAVHEGANTRVKFPPGFDLGRGPAVE